jgi:hypothetical protein
MRLQLAIEQLVHLQIRNLAEGRPSGLAAYLLLPVIGRAQEQTFSGHVSQDRERDPAFVRCLNS